MEEWRVIEEAKRYSVSSYGRVWDNKRDVEVSKVLAGVKGNQYYYVNLQTDKLGRKLRKLSRLVAKAFIPEVDNKPIVDHIDREKLNDCVSNLRWANAQENSRNMDTNVYTEHEGVEILLLDFINSDEKYKNSYSWFRDKLGSMTLKEAIVLYEDEYRNYSEVVEWKGAEIKLKELCDLLDKDFRSVALRFRSGWDAWSSIYNVPPIGINTTTIRSGSVSLCFNSLKHLSDSSGRTFDICKRAVEDGWEYQELVDYSYDPRSLYDIGGISKTREDWIEFYETSMDRVKSNMSTHKLSFSEAVVIPVERVKFVNLNGVRTKVKDMFEEFGIERKAGCNLRSKNKLTFKETLSRFGVDVTDIRIETL